METSQERQFDAFQVEHALNSLRESRKINSGPVQFVQGVEGDMTHHSGVLGKARDGMRGFADHVNHAQGKSRATASGLLAGLIRRI